MLNIILIAPPAAGKGTQSELLTKKYNIPHISTGRLIRQVNDENINKLLATGQLLDDKFVLNLLEKRLKNTDCLNGFIMDGFPRNINQAKMYDELMNEIHSNTVVIYFDIDKDLAMKRAIGRLECKNCSAIYNDQFLDSSPKESLICDVCGQQLSRRVDDTEETFKKRYDEYLKETYPLIEYYKNKNMLYFVDSSINKETTFNQIEKIIRGINE